MHKNVYDFLFFFIKCYDYVTFDSQRLKPSCYLITFKTVFCDEHYILFFKDDMNMPTVVRLYKIDTTKKVVCHNKLQLIIIFIQKFFWFHHISKIFENGVHLIKPYT